MVDDKQPVNLTISTTEPGKRMGGSTKVDHSWIRIPHAQDLDSRQFARRKRASKSPRASLSPTDSACNRHLGKAPNMCSKPKSQNQPSICQTSYQHQKWTIQNQKKCLQKHADVQNRPDRLNCKENPEVGKRKIENTSTASSSIKFIRTRRPVSLKSTRRVKE